MDSQLEVTLCYRYLNTIIIQDQSNLKYFLILLIFLTITIDLIYKKLFILSSAFQFLERCFCFASYFQFILSVQLRN